MIVTLTTKGTITHYCAMGKGPSQLSAAPPLDRVPISQPSRRATGAVEGGALSGWSAELHLPLARAMRNQLLNQEPHGSCCDLVDGLAYGRRRRRAWQATGLSSKPTTETSCGQRHHSLPDCLDHASRFVVAAGQDGRRRPGQRQQLARTAQADFKRPVALPDQLFSAYKSKFVEARWKPCSRSHDAMCARGP